MLPPMSMMMVKPDNFVKVGLEFKEYFIQLAGLQPDHKVLDVGCGAGRMAVPLTGFLTNNGGYWGFDTRRDAVEWCTEHITPKHSNFQFMYSDVFHSRYNPDGKVHAPDYHFPFEDGFFDLVILISVYTHMLPEDVEAYTKEIARVLKKNGKCFITYFLLTNDPKSLNRSKAVRLEFSQSGGDHSIIKENETKWSVGYRNEYISNLYQINDLEIEKNLKYGEWSGRDDYLGSQDILIASKK